MSASIPRRFLPDGIVSPAAQELITRLNGLANSIIDPWIAMPDPGLRPSVTPLAASINVGPAPLQPPFFLPTPGPYVYTINASDAILVQGNGAFVSNGGRFSTGSSLVNNGIIWSEGSAAVPIGSGTGWHRITNTGDIVAISQNFSVAVDGGTLNNSGDIIAMAFSAQGLAYGYQTDNLLELQGIGATPIVNSGRIYAWSASGNARGMSLFNTTTVENTGEIHARGFGESSGIKFLQSGTLNNSGIITAISGGDIQIGPITFPKQAVAVFAIDGGLTVTNTQLGIIAGDFSLVSTSILRLDNAGTIYGTIVAGLESTNQLSNFFSQITNSGSIYGDIFLGDSADRYTNTGLTVGTVYMGDGADTATGSQFNDDLAGEAGDDVIDGGAGDDILIGGTGRDVLVGGAGFDIASYEFATQGQYLVFGDGGNWRGEAVGDQLFSIEGLIGSNFNDVLAVDNDANYLSGLAGNDELYGLGGDDILVGGAGADYLDGSTGFDAASYENASTGVYVVFGDGASWSGDAAGDNLVSIEDLIGSQFNDVLAVGDGTNILDGLGGDDILLGLGGDDIIFGGSGGDVLEGGKGADFLDGGEGADAASYDRATAGVYLVVGDSGNWSGEAAGDVLVNIENIIGTQFNDIVLMDGANNALTGGNGDDQLYGQGGDDRLDGGAGRDLLIGGVGTDTAIYASSAAGVYVFLGDGGNWSGDGAGDILISIENIEGSSFNDIFGLDDGDNQLRGGAGNDMLFGLAGNDVLDGGSGGDQLIGGNGTDLAIYGTAAGGIYLFVGDFGNATGDASGDTFTSIENVTGTSFSDVIGWDNFANTLDGGDGDDFLFGQGGNDNLIGSGGNDILVGGVGGDQLIGGAGRDLASYVTSTSALYLLAGDFGNTNGDAIGDVYTSIEGVVGTDFNDIIGWSSGADWIDGGAGNDRLFGLAGGDIIIGGAGDDTMTGGGGADVFRYFGRGFGADVITDFRVGEDILDFRGSGFTVIDLSFLEPDGLRIVFGAGDVTDSIKLLGVTFNLSSFTDVFF